jgi:hypothetical protein
MVAFCSLENPEYDGQNVHFDAAIYLSPEKRANASLRYFNQANITFEIQGYYVVIAQVGFSHSWSQSRNYSVNFSDIDIQKCSWSLQTIQNCGRY